MTPEQLRAGRLRLGLTQAQMASVFGVAKPTLYLYETGKQKIPPWLKSFKSKKPKYLYVHYGPDGSIDASADTVDELARMTYRTRGSIYSMIAKNYGGWKKIPMTDVEGTE